MSGRIDMNMKKYAFECDRKGSVIALMAVSLTMLVGMAGLGIDVGMAYRHRAAMQLACDAAALAACVESNDANALAKARQLAGANGFVHGENGCQVTGARVTGSRGDYDVTIIQPYLTTFVRAVGATSINVGTTARGHYDSLAPININGGGTPGQSMGLTTLSLFGPYAWHSYGDAYSTKYLNNGQANPTYNPRGQDFLINLPANYRTLYGNTLRVDVFDPDCGNPGDVDDGTGLADEIRPKNTNVATPSGFSTTTQTRYSLYAVPGDPNDQTTHTLVTAPVTYGENDSTSQEWVTPSGFSINLDNHPGINTFRLNVTAISGSSENGFHLRAGPPTQAVDANGDWVSPPAALNMISSTGVLPLNFNGTGTATFQLGALPAAAGTPYTVRITKFDIDVGATRTVTYADSIGTSFPAGTVPNPANDVYSTDTIAIAASYAGANFRVNYQAGGQDTSSWVMSFDGSAPGIPGKVKLVR
jgi:hypothetical protein